MGDDCMKGNCKEYLYWGTNKEWYDYDENDQPFLTEKAPERARKSFELYNKIVEEQKKTVTHTV
jgi:hypothetical protein